MNLEYRRVGPNDPTPYRIQRWAVHEANRPHAIVAYAATRWIAKRRATALMRRDALASRSYVA